MLNVVFREGVSVFKFLAGLDESLKKFMDAILVFDLWFDAPNRVALLDIQSQSLAVLGYDFNLHICLSI